MSAVLVAHLLVPDEILVEMDDRVGDLLRGADQDVRDALAGVDGRRADDAVWVAVGAPEALIDAAFRCAVVRVGPTGCGHRAAGVAVALGAGGVADRLRASRLAAVADPGDVVITAAFAAAASLPPGVGAFDAPSALAARLGLPFRRLVDYR